MNKTEFSESILAKGGLQISILYIIVSAFVLVIFMLTTSPSQVGPQGVTMFFSLLYLFVLSVLEGFHRGLLKKRYWAFWLRAAYALAPVYILALASLRQLSSVDLIMVIALIAAATIYHNRHL